MKRLTEGWFEWKGIRSDAMGIRLQAMPERTLPARKTTRKPVAGRNGRLTYGDKSYEDASARILCDLPDPGNLRKVLAWLTGEGKLRFSDESEYVYDASIDDEYARSSIAALLSGQRFTVKWNCSPFMHLYSEADPITITQSGTSIENPGTAPALPRVEIIGGGDFSLTIGLQTVYFFDVEGGIIIDSELGDALTPDGSQLANDKMDGELFELQPGFNVVSWITGEGAAVSSVKITPRWRYL